MKISTIKAIDGSTNCIVGGWVVAKIKEREDGKFLLCAVHGEELVYSTADAAIEALNLLLHGQAA